VKKAKKIVYSRVSDTNTKYPSCVLQNLTVQQLGGNTEGAALQYLKKKHPKDKEIVIKQIDWE
jgi:hypothetical protein